jgi:cationic amino acid transporter 1
MWCNLTPFKNSFLLVYFVIFSLFGALFPLPRIIYAMSSDGVIFRFLGKVNKRFKTPVIGTIIAGVLTG